MNSVNKNKIEKIHPSGNNRQGAKFFELKSLQDGYFSVCHIKKEYDRKLGKDQWVIENIETFNYFE